MQGTNIIYCIDQKLSLFPSSWLRRENDEEEVEEDENFVKRKKLFPSKSENL